MADSVRMTQDSEPSRHEVWRMFNRIAPRYDFLNHFLSFNRDVAWRNKVTSMLPGQGGIKVLDLASGTGDQLLSLFDSGRVLSGVGIDPAESMLEIGRKKIEERQLGEVLNMELGTAERIEHKDSQFDAVTIAFGIRNVVDVDLALREMHRVLKPGGRALILEFSLPSNRILKTGYLFYLRHILPRLGALLSGDAEAYRYLNVTVESFPYGNDFCDLMHAARFKTVSFHPMTLGVATIYCGDK